MAASGAIGGLHTTRHPYDLVDGFGGDGGHVFDRCAAVGDLQESAGAVAERGAEWVGGGWDCGGWEKGELEKGKRKGGN